MSKEQTVIAELYAADAAKRLVGPMQDFQDAINQQLVPDVMQWDAGAKSEADIRSAQEADVAANEAFIEKALDLLPSSTFHENRPGDGHNFDTMDCEDPASALMAYRTLRWGPAGDRGYDIPYYPIGQSGSNMTGYRMIVMPATGRDKTVRMVNTTTGILRNKELFSKASKKDIKTLGEFRNPATGTFEVSQTDDRNFDSEHKYSLKEPSPIRNSYTPYGLTSEVVEEFGIIEQLTKLAGIHGKAEEFAKLTAEWKGLLPPQHEGSEADPIIIAQLAGHIGLAGSVSVEQSTEPERNLLDLS